jgi:hypothetical protein
MHAERDDAGRVRPHFDRGQRQAEAEAAQTRSREDRHAAARLAAAARGLNPGDERYSRKAPLGEPGQVPLTQASQQLNCEPTHAVPFFGARHCSALRLTEHLVTVVPSDRGFVRQQVTKSLSR